MEERERPAYYAVIPASIRYNKSLKASEKLLYGEITALCNKRGFCWATNSYFAELYGVSKFTVSGWISSLARAGYIKIKIVYKEGSQEIQQRQIFILDVLMKNSIPIEESVNTPIEENANENTINKNIINNNINNVEQAQPHVNSLLNIPSALDKKVTKNKSSARPEGAAESVTEIITYLNERLGTKYSDKTTTTMTDITTILSRGYTVDQCKQVIDRKYDDWQGTEMEKYLRPSTLFRFSKFENYVNCLGLSRRNRGGVTRVPERQAYDEAGGKRRIEILEGGTEII